MKAPFVSVMVGMLICGFAGRAQAADDWQYWNGVKLTYALHEQWDVQIKLEQRVTSNVGEFGLHNYAPGVVYKPNRHLQYAIGYKHELEKIASRWSEEHRLEQILTLKGSWLGFNGRVGTRFEYRSLDAAERWRWREKMTVSRAIALGTSELLPYVSNEVFYDFKTDAYNQNRAVIGVAKKISSRVELNLYYMYKTSLKSSGWSGANIIGTGMTITL